MKKNVIMLFAGLFFFSASASAAGISVTKVTVAPYKGDKYYTGVARIVIDGAIEIKEIMVMHSGARLMLKFPENVSRNGNKYTHVTLATEQANEAVRTAILSRKTSGNAARAARPVSFDIVKLVKYRKPSKLKAFAAVRFNGAVEIECRILESETGAWVSWPARRDKGKNRWIDTVRILDSRLKNDVEAALLKKYGDKAWKTDAKKP
ncbi:MAG: septation protein SpoVG family protein [Elusimicrobiota bacterium]